MGESSRFFLWLWRFNAIVIALLGACLAAIVAFSFGQDFLVYPIHNKPADNFLATPHAPADNVSYQLELGGTSLEGTSDVIFGLQRLSAPTSRETLQFSSGGPSRDSNTVNILVVDGATATSHWLFKGTDRIIWSDSTAGVKTIAASDDPKSPVVALVIEAAVAHPDKSGTLKADGPDTLYFYRIGGDGVVKFFSAGNIRSMVQIDAGRLLVVYQNGRSIGTATFSTKDFTLAAQSPVPPVAKSK